MGTTKTKQVNVFKVSEVNTTIQKKMETQWFGAFVGTAIFLIGSIIQIFVFNDEKMASAFAIIGLVLLTVGFYLIQLHSALSDTVNSVEQHWAPLDVEEAAEEATVSN